MENKIANVVFYKFNGEQGVMQQACIFYEDGTVKNCMYEEGLEAAEAIAQEENSTKDSFKELINKNRIYVLSGREFERRFKEFLIVKEEPAKVYIKNAIDEALANTTTGDLPMVVEEAKVVPLTKVINLDNKKVVNNITEEEKNEEKVIPQVIPMNNIIDEEEKEEEIVNNETVLEIPDGEEIIMDSPLDSEEDKNNELPADDEIESEEIDNEEIIDEDNKATKRVIIPPIGIYPEEVIEIPSDNMAKAADKVEDYAEDAEDLDDELEEELNNNELKEPEEVEDEVKEGFIRRGLRKLKNSAKKHWKKITAVVVALAIGVGLYSCANKNTKEGEILNNNIGIHSLIGDDKDGTKTAQESNTKQEVKSNDQFNGYSYDQLLGVTNNKVQKAEMMRIHDALHAYNDTFANAWLEEGKDVKAALSFEEMIALSQAYNQFSPQDIKAIFNGYGMRAYDLENAYKTGTLQLMAAHVIESREHPVDMSGIIVSEEGKAFYNKYHELFLTAKEAEGDAKVEAVEAFYNELHKDFPISDEIREEGISHADGRAQLEAYKLSVVPMVAAGEIMWQNLEIDNTLKGGVSTYFLDFANFEGLTKEELLDKVAESGNGVVYGDLDYFNDLGLCNFAEEQFEIVQQVTMSACANEDDTNPLYEQYRDAIVDELTKEGNYVIDDAHRDLSRLDRFQDIVNWHFGLTDEGYYTGQVIEHTETWTEKRTWTETEKHTTYRTETTKEHKPIPADEKEKIDKQIEKENKEAKDKAEKEAEKKRQEMQKEEDKKTEENKKKVDEENKDMQDKIDDANKKIDDGGTVNEDDFGDHDVDFDDEHSDKDGNLDDSVKDITTDPTGDQSGKDLPDPNKTGEEFDKKAPTDKNDPEEGYDVIVEENKEENPKTSTDEKKEEPKKEETKKEEPKQETPKEEPKQEAPKEEPKQEAPKQEAPKEEPKQEAPKQEAPKSDPVEEQEIEEYEGEVTEDDLKTSSNEAKADAIVEAMAKQSSSDDSAKVLKKA